ncbi:MAG: dynamin family protein [Gammaproteobacteria bacterium]|nr:dynamin family protein [Gammaproteobacteria bacterium]NNJ48916.1 dynamin family protein [Gammaproteobacteria bacterium]
MLNRPDKSIRDRLTKLETHLNNENPLLIDVVSRFKKLDTVAYKMGLLDTTDSYATSIPWWPLVSILGTFSAGKSSFINNFLDDKLQLTGNQAVDDKFTVITYSNSKENRVLPGIALNSDPRFPFYQMSDEIDKVASGEGRRIDAYLQMKTSHSDKLSGKILIDSPGFDADEQRNAILRLTDHIVDLSDLVLVLFDARHPEPGAMQDTLDHLVGNTINRSDSEKFLYILNQIDTAAQEDNPEAVVAAWQRALAAKGLTAGRFYSIYNQDVAVPIEDEAVRQRFESKCEQDKAAIFERIHQVEVERSYRILGALQTIAGDIENHVVPVVKAAMTRWLKMVLTIDAIAIGIFMIVLFVLSNMFDSWALFSYDFTDEAIISSLKLSLTVVGFLVVHFTARAFSARVIAKKLMSSIFADKSLAGEHREGKILAGSIKKAFLKNTQPLRSLFRPMPVGWSMRSKRTLAQVAADASEFIQTMNDRYTRPSGMKEPDTAAQVNPVQGEAEPADANQAASVEPLSTVKSETH